MSRLSLILCLWACSIHVYAQDTNRVEHLDTASASPAPKLIYRYTLVGLGRPLQQNTFLSPNYYKGFAIEVVKGRVYRVKSGHKEISSSLLSSLMTFRDYSVQNIQYQFWFRRDYQILGEVTQRRQLPNIYMGFLCWEDFLLSTKPSNGNNPSYFQLNHMIGPHLALGKNLFKDKLQLGYGLSTVLLGIYSSSEYSSTLPYFFLEDDAGIKGVFTLGSFGKNFQTRSVFTLDYYYRLRRKKLKKNIRLQYEYRSQFFENHYIHSRANLHVFRLGYLFNKTPYHYDLESKN